MHRLTGLVGLLLVTTACGGGGSPTGVPTQLATQPAGQPTAPPPAGGATVAVTLTGGPHAGSYTATASPNCSNGLIGPGGWGVQYSIEDATDDQMGGFQLVLAADGEVDNADALYPGIKFLMTVTMGDFIAVNSPKYVVAVVTEQANRDPSGDGTALVSDGGSTAVITATGTTEDGVQIAATVTCPSVLRV